LNKSWSRLTTHSARSEKGFEQVDAVEVSERSLGGAVGEGRQDGPRNASRAHS
jgi:hypothetical protein